jgi:hypothetical protein
MKHKPLTRDMNTTPQPIPLAIRKTVEQATRLLDACKTKYIIVLSDGTTINKGGEIIQLVPDKPEKPRKAKSLMPYGTYRNMYGDTVKKMVLGDVEVFRLTPEMVAAGVDLVTIMGSISSMASNEWGNNAHKIFTNKDNNTVELLRTA